MVQLAYLITYPVRDLTEDGSILSEWLYAPEKSASTQHSKLFLSLLGLVEW